MDRFIDLKEKAQEQLNRMSPEERARLVKTLEAIEPEFNEEEYINERQKGIMERLNALQKKIEDLERGTKDD